MKVHQAHIFLISGLVLLFVYPFDLSAQCAMCKEAAATSLKSDPTGMARSLNSGILYLMAVPYVMILFIFRKQVVHVSRLVLKKFSKKHA